MLQQKEFFWQEIHWVDPLHVTEILKIQKKEPMLFFSGITLPTANGGDFSFLPFRPTKTLLFREGTDFLKLLKNNLGTRRNIPDNAPKIFRRFCGGLCGFFSYDFAHEFEKFSYNYKRNSDIPLAFFRSFKTFFAFDHINNRAFLAGWFRDGREAHQFFDSHQISLDQISVEERGNIAPEFVFVPEISRVEYTAAIDDIQKELVSGNTYQVNFSQKWSTRTSASGFETFRILADKNPAPMMFFSEHENFSVISCTPERLFSLRDGTMFAQPIKGTRRRGRDSEEDALLTRELLNDPKELAEHSMIVDLIRNDFGRVADFGTVEVRDFLRVEKYASVIHLVSDIFAKLPPEKNAFDVLQAMFPGGSITGAPKIETMDIIARLEPSTRGVYCGSAGYFSFNGNADFNILIRTLQKTGENLEVCAGGGIVVDSTAKREYAESIEKVMGIIGALGRIEGQERYETTR